MPVSPYQLVKRIPPGARLAVVEIRTSAYTGGFDKKAVTLLSGSFEDAGLSWTGVATYSLTFNKHLLQAGVRELQDALRGKYDLILAVGAVAQKYLCDTSRTQDQYAGSLTYSKSLSTWVLPSYHPSVVYVGDKKTLNSRYDKFDVLYDHIVRAASLINGEIPYPDPEGLKVDWEWIGHDGLCGGELDAGRWSGYYESTEEEVNRAQEVFTAWLDRLDEARANSAPVIEFAIDTESRNTNVFRDSAFLMLQVYDGTRAYAFNAGVLHHPQVAPLVKLFLNHGRARFDLWNTKYDRQVIWHEFGISLEDRDIDGMVLAMGVTEKGRQCGLKYRSRQDLNAHFYEEGLEAYVDKNDVDYSCIPPRILAEYGCLDVYCTYEEIPILQKRIEKEGTAKLIPFLMDAQRVLADVEYQGLEVDVEFAKRMSAEWGPKIENAIREVQDYARDVGFPLADSGIGLEYKSVCGCVPELAAQQYLAGARVLSYAKLLREQKIELPTCECCNNKRYVSRLDVTLNVNSSVQMQHLAFDILKMKELPYDGRSTNKDFWKLNGNHPLAKLVHSYKELQYLRRNFLEGIQRFVAEDGKVHPDFLLFGTKTGRLAIRDPAAQTLPQHGENAKTAKKLIIAEPDCLIVNSDYSSLEMFVAHHLTQDERLLENLTAEWDIHVALAAMVYDKAPEAVTDKERQSVKPVNFGAGYNIGAFKLALDPAMEESTGGDPDKAQQFLDMFWGMYSTWHACTQDWKEKAVNEFHLTTEMGRKRRWTLITKDNLKRVENQAVNFAGQSLASDLCLSSLIKLHWALQDRGWGRVLLTVHDSLVFNIKKEFLHDAVALIEKEMVVPPFETSTPFSVDISVGISYGEQEPYDPERDYYDR